MVMEERYYQSKIVPPSPELEKDYYRPALDDVVPPVSFIADVIPTDKEGRPTEDVVLCYVVGEDYSGVDQRATDNAPVQKGDTNMQGRIHTTAKADTRTWRS
jgi:hypothetical protein